MYTFENTFDAILQDMIIDPPLSRIWTKSVPSKIMEFSLGIRNIVTNINFELV